MTEKPAFAQRVVSNPARGSGLNLVGGHQVLGSEVRCAMAVFALWSAPRTRPTAFFHSMVEHSDMTVLYELSGSLRPSAGSLILRSSRKNPVAGHLSLQ
jgi:hypothetical protein